MLCVTAGEGQTLRAEKILKMFENVLLRRIFASKAEGIPVNRDYAV
jgi:hypothetical protein